MSNDGARREAENAIRFLRGDIDAIDLQLVALLVQRARLAVRIGEIKEYAELPVVELGREQQVLDRVEKLRTPPLDAHGLREIFTAIMLTMRRLQTPASAAPVAAKNAAKKKAAASRRR
jgi:chorismate mutase / prephenate dehydratase